MSKAKIDGTSALFAAGLYSAPYGAPAHQSNTKAPSPPST